LAAITKDGHPSRKPGPITLTLPGEIQLALWGGPKSAELEFISTYQSPWRVFFSSPRTRLRWAKSKLAELKFAIDSFLNSNPQRRVIELDVDGIQEWHKVTIDDVPDDVIRLSVELAEALRSVLDHTGYAAAVIGGNLNPTNAYFPICRTAGEFKNCVRGRCVDPSLDIT
jgi:hypothetical protein